MPFLVLRYVPMFGETDYQPELAYSAVPIEEQLEALAQAQQAGKIREFGVSNETAWGLMRFCELGEALLHSPSNVAPSAGNPQC